MSAQVRISLQLRARSIPRHIFARKGTLEAHFTAFKLKHEARILAWWYRMQASQTCVIRQVSLLISSLQIWKRPD